MKTSLTIRADRTTRRIHREIYGHFAEHLGRCVYEGLWVGEDSPIPNTRGIRNDVLEALKRLNVPVLRWPGGCFADEYHWKDGVGPRGSRRRTINTHWGGVTETNHFGTHEFMLLCELLGCEPYISGNVGSGTVQEMQEWIEYITLESGSSMAEWRRANGRERPWRLKYFGVGNENWGCGGNMRAEYYADVYRRYQTYVRHYGDNRVFRIACGANAGDYHWTETLMREAGRYMDGLSLHYYTVPGTWMHKGPATGFGEREWFATLNKALVMDELIRKHAAIMDKYDPEKRVALVVDEWGTWYDPEPGTNPAFLYQQNTMRDALVAGLTLHVFHRHCDRVRMANLAQVTNVLQSVVLTDGPKMVLTPTYHVFEMFKEHQGAERLDCGVETGACGPAEFPVPRISASASRTADGRIHLSVCHADLAGPVDVEVVLDGLPGVRPRVSGRVLTGPAPDAHNTFEAPDAVRPAPLVEVRAVDSGFGARMPAMSVALFEIEVGF